VSVEDERRRTCIVVAFVDGSLRAYDFLDEDSAARWYGECGQEWNAGRSVVLRDAPRGHRRVRGVPRRRRPHRCDADAPAPEPAARDQHLRGLLDLHLELIDEVEREFASH
jgi:hypothetical protein